MPTTRSTSVPSPAATPARRGGAAAAAPAPAPASRATARRPPPQPMREGSTWVDTSTLRNELPCYVVGAAGAEPLLDLTRVFLTGSTCAEGSRMALGLRLAPLAAGLKSSDGSDDFAEVMASAEAMAHSTRGDQSRAYRDRQAKVLLAEHIVGLVQHHGSLFLSDGCVLLDGALERQRDDEVDQDAQLARQLAASQLVASPPVDLTGAGGSVAGGDGGAAGSSPSGEQESKDDQDALGFIARTQRKFSCPKLTLAVFTDKLPNKRGVDKAQLDQDSKDARALQKAYGVAGGASAAGGGASHSSRSRGGLAPPAPMHFGGGALPQHGGPRLSAYLPPARGGGSRSAGFGVGQPVMLPLAPGAPGGQRGGKGHGAGRAAPGGGSSSSQPLSGRARSAVADFNGIMQDAQQQFVPVPNGPTCDKCASTKKNPHHEFRSCAFSLCSRCKRGGHRAKKCPF
ncbi:unnamed protein product [Pylaiella littoralis]